MIKIRKSWKVLAICAAAWTVTSFVPTRAHAQDVATQHSQFLVLLNKLRTDKGLPTMAPQSNLNTAAQAFAEWLAKDDKPLGHVGDNGSMPPERARAAGYDANKFATENVAIASSPETAYNAWLGSPGHKANMLFFPATESGLGVATSPKGNMYWVSLIGGSLRGVNYGSGNDGVFNYYSAWRSYYATGALKKTPNLSTTVERNADLDAAVQKVVADKFQAIAAAAPDQIDLDRDLAAPLMKQMPTTVGDMTIVGCTVGQIPGPPNATIGSINMYQPGFLLDGTLCGVAYAPVKIDGFDETYAVVVIAKKNA
ncbi:hypothetical protein IAD21_01895 [Abditibacteriota bacterium]|nr:hypothetical protein IAD21_01895 [Abditibacteriota bacterium]